ncbi:hypothetical protein ACQP2F_19535 [Actinoplanes sp. CA-030573]|uniref:hypothetical protein n=1 Tax=Actinoplanes sp. CA-030573 TaxID=3239898 RepID=UPI003D8B4E74
MATPAESNLTTKRLEDLSARLPDIALALTEEDRDLLRACFLRGADAYLKDAEAKPVPLATFAGGRGDGWSIGDFQQKKTSKPTKRPPQNSSYEP